MKIYHIKCIHSIDGGEEIIGGACLCTLRGTDMSRMPSYSYSSSYILLHFLQILHLPHLPHYFLALSHHQLLHVHILIYPPLFLLLLLQQMLSAQAITVQVALLYTNSSGERRIRVHTVLLPVVQVSYISVVCSVVQCSVLYCTVLYCTVLYCSALYCSIV